jgi:hypothetical protein
MRRTALETSLFYEPAKTGKWLKCVTNGERLRKCSFWTPKPCVTLTDPHKCHHCCAEMCTNNEAYDFEQMLVKLKHEKTLKGE